MNSQCSLAPVLAKFNIKYEGLKFEIGNILHQEAALS
jgi:hypothetical protein